ncbi:MAG: hypothetical protein ACJ73W_09970 [Rubrobacteraceae bacterium]
MMDPEPQNLTSAYQHGLKDGRYGELCCFTENAKLATLEEPSDRLDYYKGHRAGREMRLRDGHLLEAS